MTALDCFSFNENIIREELKGNRKTKPLTRLSFQNQAAKYRGLIRLACASEYKHGIEITSIRVIDVDNHERMTFQCITCSDKTC